MKSQRVRRSPAEARSEILEAAQAAIGEVGFGALTVDDVMRRTGMTRSSFYHYFSSIDALARGLLEALERAIRASVDPWLEGEVAGADRPEATVVHLTAMLEVMEAHRPAMYAVTQAVGHPRVYEQWKTRVLDDFIDLTAAYIRRQVASGRSAVEDPDRLARALILMNHAVASDNLAHAVRDAPADVARVLADVWNAAIYGSAARSAVDPAT